VACHCEEERRSNLLVAGFQQIAALPGFALRLRRFRSQ
jgi:hypothetical protein